ncbi:MAG: hypothetical protein ACX94A_13935 [Algiphilus sp.]
MVCPPLPEENIKWYAELAKMFPKNVTYAEKLAHYRQKKAQGDRERREAREQRIAKFGELPSRSAWSGSYLPVDRYLDQALKDPDSLEMDGCTKVYHVNDGWLVGCDYRAKNSFGGYVRESKWFTIRHHAVVSVDPASAYSP